MSLSTAFVYSHWYKLNAAGTQASPLAGTSSFVSTTRPPTQISPAQAVQVLAGMAPAVLAANPSLQPKDILVWLHAFTGTSWQPLQPFTLSDPTTLQVIRSLQSWGT